MRYVLLTLAAVVALIVVVVLVGWMLPVAHRSTREATFKAAPADLFKLITDVQKAPEWRSSVKEVQVLPSVGGHAQFREIGKNGSILFQVDSIEPDRLLVTRIADRSLPFGGKWTYELVPRGDSTTLRITEDGEVYNPVFRFVSRFIMGHTATIDEYLRDVRNRVAPSVVEGHG
jgi:uncharacterized protein YndB with AHSA1/START domain